MSVGQLWQLLTRLANRQTSLFSFSQFCPLWSSWPCKIYAAMLPHVLMYVLLTTNTTSTLARIPWGLIWKYWASTTEENLDMAWQNIWYQQLVPWSSGNIVSYSSESVYIFGKIKHIIMRYFLVCKPNNWIMLAHDQFCLDFQGYQGRF